MALVVDSTGRQTRAPSRTPQAQRRAPQPSLAPPNNQYGMYDAQGRYVSPGLGAPGGGEFAEFVPGSGVPDTSVGMMTNINGQRVASSTANASPYVGIPYGSSLYIQAVGKKGQIRSFKSNVGIEYNTYTAFNNFFAQSSGEIKKFQRQLVNLGYLTESDINGRWGQKSDPKTRAALAQLMYEGNLSGRPWFDVLMQGAQGTTDQGPGGPGSGRQYPYTDVTRTRTISTMQDARLILRQTMQQMLGREPTNDEVKGFLAELNVQERKNPQVSKTQVSSPDERSTVNKGGFNPTAYAEDWTEEEFPKEYNRFQQDSYEDMALESIRSL